MLIGYCKNGVIIRNSFARLSDKIVMKEDDLITLIGILLEIDKKNISISVEDPQPKYCCCCEPTSPIYARYKRVNDIIIDNKKSFEVNYNQYYVQMSTEFNICLEHISVL
jgi:hypothetical protein